MSAPDPGDISTIPKSPGGVLLCFGCHHQDACRLGVTTLRSGEDGGLLAELSCPAEYEGGPGVAHGGWVASVLDEVVGLACVFDRHQLSVTGELTIRYLKPTPLGSPLLVIARVDRLDGVRGHASGELILEASGAVLAEAHGIFIARDGEHYDRHRQWLATQNEVLP